VISYVSWCSAIFNGNIEASLISSTVITFFLHSVRHFWHWHQDWEYRDSTEVLYSTSQQALLRVPHFRQTGQISRPTRVMQNVPYNSYLQAQGVRCALLSLLRPLGDRSVFPVPLSQRINIYILFRSVDLHHCCYQIFEKHLSISPFMNLMSFISEILRPMSYRSYFDFHTFWISAYHAHKQNRRKETILNTYKTIFPSQSHNFPFRVSNVTPSQWVSINVQTSN